MIHLNQYFIEKLSDKGIQKITDFLKNSDAFNDNDVDQYIKILNKYSKNSGSTNNSETYTKFFDKHGLTELNWGRKNSAIKQFTNLFDEEDKLDILNQIIENDGVISIDNVADQGNIFSDFCKGWEDEAKNIASWTNSRSANAGPCEILLKFLIREANSRIGDVGIDADEEMEVKAATLNGRGGSGGHAAGQKGKIRQTWSVYFWLNKSLFNLGEDNANADKCTYFQNDNGIKEFNDLIVKNKLDYDKVIEEIINALCFQYNFITNEKNAKNTTNNLNLLIKAAKEYAKKSFDSNKGFTDGQVLINLVGCTQLYLYSQIEQFDYLFTVLIDKNIENESSDNGFYLCFKNCKDKDTTLLNFNKVTEHIVFGKLDSTTSSQGRTGKIKIKIAKQHK